MSMFSFTYTFHRSPGHESKDLRRFRETFIVCSAHVSGVTLHECVRWGGSDFQWAVSTSQRKISVTLLAPTLRCPSGIRARLAIKHSVRSVFWLWIGKTSAWHLSIPRDPSGFYAPLIYGTLRENNWTRSAAPRAQSLVGSSRTNTATPQGNVGLQRFAAPRRWLMPPSVKESVRLLHLLHATLRDWYPFGRSGLQSLATSSGAKQLITREKSWGEKGSESFFYPLTKVPGFLSVPTKLP